jgi:hypothetical protein|tara:strand:+ start:2233 stop:2451 length:219 start_codon:yes stop_codon:yes gene_type:complete
MKFLLVWIVSGGVLDSGLRYDDATSCFAAAKNSGIELNAVGLRNLKFTCIPVAAGKGLKVLIAPTSRSPFPF